MTRIDLVLIICWLGAMMTAALVTYLTTYNHIYFKGYRDGKKEGYRDGKKDGTIEIEVFKVKEEDYGILVKETIGEEL